MQEIDFQDLLIDAWNKFKGRWKPLSLASLIGYFLPMVAFFGVYLVVMWGLMSAKRMGHNPDPSAMMPIFIGIPFFMVFLFLFSVGCENYCMKICRGENPKNKDFFLSGKTYLRIIAAEFLVAIAASLGTIFFIIPGLILYFFFQLVSYAVIDHPEFGIIDCLKHSWKLVKQNWKPIIILNVIVYAIQSVISGTVIGLIPAVPFGILVTSLLYTKFNDSPAEHQQPQPNVIPPTYQA